MEQERCDRCGYKLNRTNNYKKTNDYTGDEAYCGSCWVESFQHPEFQRECDNCGDVFYSEDLHCCDTGKQYCDTCYNIIEEKKSRQMKISIIRYEDGKHILDGTHICEDIFIIKDKENRTVDIVMKTIPLEAVAISQEFTKGEQYYEYI